MVQQSLKVPYSPTNTSSQNNRSGMVHKQDIISLCVIISIIFTSCSISCDSDNHRISKRIFFNTERKDILDYDGKYVEIPPIVTGYTKIGNLILVKWNPDYPIPAIYDKYEYGYSEDSCTLYWIIDLNNEKQKGPMDSTSFAKSCSSYGIPEMPEF